MTNVTADMSMSLDGFITGPNESPENPLGDGGERLHEWVYELASWREQHGLDGGKTNGDSEIYAESIENVGAVVMGRGMFSNEDGPWGDTPFEGHWGDDPPFRVPVFVLTHHPRKPLVKEGGTTFTFVTDGIESAHEQARAVAGDQDISVAGGADTIQQFISAGLLDELEVHLVPVLLSEGINLFEHLGTELIELERTRVVESPNVTHLRFRVVN
jgi:dihydrofolate reductase